MTRCLLALQPATLQHLKKVTVHLIKRAHRLKPVPDIENLLKQVEFTLACLFNKALSLFAVSDAEFILWWPLRELLLKKD